MEIAEKKHDIELEVVDDRIYNFNFNLASTDVKLLESICTSFHEYAKLHVPDIKGVVRHKTKKGQITTRKSPCGEGTNTWNRYRIAVHSRSFCFNTTSSVLQKFANFLKNSNIEISLLIN